MAAATEAVELAAYVGYIDAVVGYYWGGGRWCAEVELREKRRVNIECLCWVQPFHMLKPAGKRDPFRPRDFHRLHI